MALAAPFQDSSQCLDTSPILFQQNRDTKCKRYVTECKTDESAASFVSGYYVLAQPFATNASTVNFDSDILNFEEPTLNATTGLCDNYVVDTVVIIGYDETTGLLTSANVTFKVASVPLDTVVDVTTEVVFTNGMATLDKSGSPGYLPFLPLLTDPGVALVFIYTF
jgi:hypothetical protein